MSTSPLKKFIRVSDALIKFHSHFESIPSDFHTVYNLENQSEEVKKLWDRVQDTYELCLEFLEASDKTVKKDLESANSNYEKAYMAYLSTIGTIKEKLETLVIALKSSGSPVGKEINDNCALSVTLPPCDVDIFKGDYLSWPAFRDLFTALYINNSRLSDVDRLYH